MPWKRALELLDTLGYNGHVPGEFSGVHGVVQMNRLTATVLLAFAAGCGGGGGGGGGTGQPAALAPGPALTVERFLQAANVNDLETMTELFGTRDRTIVELDGRSKAEQRMYVLASVLRHDDFAFRGQRAVPGRMNDATELLVELTRADRTAVVPHLVVRRSDGGWIIENIDVTPITNRR